MQYVNPSLSYGEESHQNYLKNGYIFLGPFLTPDGLAAALQNTDRMLRDLHPSLKTTEIYSAHQQERWILDILTAKPLLDVIEKEIGPDIVLWSSQMLCKQPRSGKAIPWHQDLTYWNIGGRTTSIWIALDDVDKENGTMYVLPGWHHKGPLERRRTTDDLFDEEIAPNALPADIDKHQVGYFLRAGEAGLHDTMVPHRSPPNGSDRWRRVLVARFMSADGKMGPKEYPNYKTTETFNRRYFLVRGQDVQNKGLERLEDVLELVG